MLGSKVEITVGVVGFWEMDLVPGVWGARNEEMEGFICAVQAVTYGNYMPKTEKNYYACFLKEGNSS